MRMRKMIDEPDPVCVCVFKPRPWVCVLAKPLPRRGTLYDAQSVCVEEDVYTARKILIVSCVFMFDIFYINCDNNRQC